MKAIYWCILYTLVTVILVVLALLAKDVRSINTAIINFTDTYALEIEE